MVYLRAFLIALALILLSNSTVVAFFDKPLTALSKRQKGKITFYSENYKTYKNLFEKEFKNQITIKGTLDFPKSQKEMIPAAVLLHGVGGLKYEGKQIFKLANDLNNKGIATFIVDSHKPRDISGAGEAMSKITDPMRISDAFSSLKLLSTHPRIDKGKIAVIGFSQGGRITLLTVAEKIRASFLDDELKFAAHLAYYPSCFYQLHGDFKTTGAPILMQLGEKDNITPAQMCIDWSHRLRSAGADIKMNVYKGAAHGWLNPALSGKVVTVRILKDNSGCQDRYTQIKDDGTIFVPYLNDSIQDLEAFNKLIVECQKSSGGERGDPSEVREESVKEGLRFLNQIFSKI